MLGRSAGDISLASLALFSIIFVWTPPHFWALALVTAEDYGRAGVPMLPNVKGPGHTRRAIFGYALLLAPLGLMPWLMGFASLAYGVIAIGLGTLMVLFSARVYHFRTAPKADRCARQLFGFSILYLFLLFAAIAGERLLPLAPFDHCYGWYKFAWQERREETALSRPAKRQALAQCCDRDRAALSFYRILCLTLAKSGTAVLNWPP